MGSVMGFSDINPFDDESIFNPFKGKGAGHPPLSRLVGRLGGESSLPTLVSHAIPNPMKMPSPAEPGAEAAPTAPEGPATRPDQSVFTRPGELAAPGFVSSGLQGLTPIQQRSKIATLGVAGEDARYRDQAVKDFYQNLVFRQLLGDTGTVAPGAEVLPIERQYLQQVYGQTPLEDTTESFLSAFLRA